jgi:hypothetical protein
MELCTVSGHLLPSKLSQRIQISQVCLALFNIVFISDYGFFFNAGKHKLLEILMDGMVPTIT